MPQLSITEIIWKIKYLKFHSNLPGANELMHRKYDIVFTVPCRPNTSTITYLIKIASFQMQKIIWWHISLCRTQSAIYIMAAHAWGRPLPCLIVDSEIRMMKEPARVIYWMREDLIDRWLKFLIRIALVILVCTIHFMIWFLQEFLIWIVLF